jgi:hypothetical protein
VSVLWRSMSTATSIRCGAQLEGPDCFLHNLSRVFPIKTLSLSRILLFCRGFSVMYTHRFDNTCSI